MSRPHAVAIQRVLRRHGIWATLVRGDARVTLRAVNRSYVERNADSGGDMRQSVDRWLISRGDLAASGWTGPPKRMDRIILTDVGSYTVDVVAPRIANGAAVAYDLTLVGLVELVA
ncbi:MAG: hypothetical protein WBN93_11205 [Acidimicrobiia bacterium]